MNQDNIEMKKNIYTSSTKTYNLFSKTNQSQSPELF